ncbi:MAG: hypothetical protein QG621_13 [Patescibacteria group bacterium]|jgi:hypothetical protein|nr:hypothetical protein [Patescibacteria group bacterium]
MSAGSGLNGVPAQRAGPFLFVKSFVSYWYRP